jgi:hypothetical protein
VPIVAIASAFLSTANDWMRSPTYCNSRSPERVVLAIASTGVPRESSHTSVVAVVNRAVIVDGIDT